MQTGKGAAPIWASVLEAAAEWGTPPWQLFAEPGSALWLARWGEYRRLRQFVSNPEMVEDDDDDDG